MSFKVAHRSTDSSALNRSSKWPTDLRGCVLDPLSSASASVAVTEIADAGRIANLECYSHSPRPPIAPAAVALPSPSGISSNHLRTKTMFMDGNIA